MGTAFAILLGVFNCITLAMLVGLYLRLKKSAQAADLESICAQASATRESLMDCFSRASSDMAARLEGTKGDLRQEVADRLGDGFARMRISFEDQLSHGRREQSERLAEVRQELTRSLALTSSQVRTEVEGLSQRTTANLEGIRDRVDQRLHAITEQVQHKLDENIREGFAQFEKVQQHLKAAEEQLREVGAIGHSINDLNNLLKLPHLRGQFGEASLERLLSDFLPAHMFALQASPTRNGGGRADAVIYFPDRCLPIDAKFPREQVLALFDGGSDEQVEIARVALVRVMKAEAKRIRNYIQPELGTTEIALMYLPSETLYLEAVRNRELADWLNAQHVFPVSPNTLLMTLQTIALVHKWYEVASRFEKSRLELGKAQKSFDYFQNQFENVGKNLNKAQEAFETAQRHLKSYRGKVTALSGQEQLELDPRAEEQLPLTDKASA